MKKKLLNSMRTLLLAAGLCVGANAWATECYDFGSWALNGYSITLSSTSSTKIIAGSSVGDYVSDGTFTYSLNSRFAIRFKDSSSRDLTNLRNDATHYGLYFYRSASFGILNLKNGDQISLDCSNIKLTSGNLSSNGETLEANSTLESNANYTVTADCNVVLAGEQYSKIRKVTIVPVVDQVLAPTLSISSMQSGDNDYYNPVINVNSTEATSFAGTFTLSDGSVHNAVISDGKFVFTQPGTLSVWGIKEGSTNSAVSKVYLAAGIYTLDNTNSVDLSSESLVDCSTWTTKTRDWANWGSINSYTFYDVPETTSFPGVTLSSVSYSSYCKGVGLLFTSTTGGGRTATISGANAGQLSETVTYSGTALTPTTSSINVVKSDYVYTFSANKPVKNFNLYTPVNKEIIGAVDKSTVFAGDQSRDIVLAEGEAKTITFINHGTTGQNYWNWLMGIHYYNTSTSAYNFKANIRADWAALDAGGAFIYGYTFSTDNGATASTGNVWTDFQSDMLDANVVLTVSHQDGYLYVIGTMKKGSNVYYFNYTYGDGSYTENIKVNLFVEKAWIEISSVETASVTTIPAHPTNVAVTLGTNGYATYANNVYPLDLTNADAYKAAVSGDKVNFTLFGQAVPASTGMLVKGTASGTVNLPIADASTAVDGNEFLVNVSGETFTAADHTTYYAMIKDSDPLTFGTFAPGTLAFPANKAYLAVAGSAARLMAVFSDDEATGIDTVNSEEITVKGYYNLAGQRVAAPQKGLYIVNGKKVAIK